MSAVLSFARASSGLGLGDDEAAGKRLCRLVLAKEKRLGIEIAVRGAGKQRPLRGVRLDVVRHHMPELAPVIGNPKADRTGLIEEARRYLRDFDERMSQVARSEAEAAIGELVQPQLDELRETSGEALKLCRDISERLSTLPKGTRPPDTERTVTPLSETLTPRDAT